MEKITKIVIVLVALLATTIGLLMILYLPSDDRNIERVEKVVSNDKSQETMVVVSKDQNACNADWSMVWGDAHALWGGMKSIVCGKNVVIEVKTQGGKIDVHNGVLSEEEEKRLYALTEAVTKTSPPHLPKILPPDFSFINLQIAQGGDIYSYQTPFNEKTPEIQALYDELERLRDQIAKEGAASN
jgi:hypothetical protein